jgi:transposase InsO family protein
VPHDTRDEIVDFVNEWADQTELPLNRFASWLGIARSKFYDWRSRYGKANEHNAWIPRDHWLEQWEKERIVEYHMRHPLEGYRCTAFMMLDQDVVAVSPSSVYRVLSDAHLLERSNQKTSKKGTGFVQPVGPHEHWHVDITYINCWGTFYYLFVIVDGFSRYIIHWDIRAAMKETDVELIIQEAREKFPGVKPRIISDNGPQFIARDFKAFIKFAGMTHVRTSPYYPQSNGKCERTIKTIKVEGIRPASPEDLDEATDAVSRCVHHYNEERLHSGIGYITPRDKLEGRANEIFAERDRKLEEARARRAESRARQREQELAQTAASSCEAVAVPA